MRRRGSRSANMLKPTVAVVQGQHQVNSDVRDVRRASEPSFHLRGMTNGGFAAPQRPQQAQNIQPDPAQPQNNAQWQHQQHQAFGQQARTRHSFASSMDLISPTYADHSNGNSSSHSLQSHLFRSSSHHTSHTAAAGDLLTMSRRALDPQPQPNQSNGFAKKRSATMADADNGNNASQINFMSTNGGNAQIIGQHHSSAANPQQQIHASQHSILSIGQKGGAFPNYTQDEFYLNNSSSSALEAAANVSSSTVDSMADKQESYQHHRTIRRCRRSDSFEMMEDG